jgi:hypothetical protein
MIWRTREAYRWTTWLGRRTETTDADDVVVDPFFEAH